MVIANSAWQGQQDSNPRPSVLETDALPTELYPFRRTRHLPETGAQRNNFHKLCGENLSIESIYALQERGNELALRL